jgi:flavin reductase (DIM6/NTAB) family NADH-FMN oxidoreductase RutF
MPTDRTEPGGPSLTLPAEPDLSELPALDGRHFRRACSRFASGITIVTVADHDGVPHGMTASSFTSVSLDPPLILVCVGSGTKLVDTFRAVSHFAVNVLGEAQRSLSQQFAGSGYDRFAGIPWRSGHAGVPLFPDVLATIECERYEIVTAGDHDILIGKVIRAEYREGEPLVHFGSQYRELEPSPGWWSNL